MTYAEMFRERSGRKWLYNIMPIDNISSVMQNGILSYNNAEPFQHRSIAMEGVQALRDRKRVLNGLLLHDYASLYFNPRNPMMFKRQAYYREICVLVVDPSVLDFDGVVITDGNAANSVSRFFPPAEGLSLINFEKIYDRYWNHDDPFVHDEHKRVECAEVLVPHQVPCQYIVGAYAAIEESKSEMQAKGFDRRIVVKADMFFQGR